MGSENNVKTQIKNTVLIIVGTFIIAFGTALFIIPFNLVAGGMPGIGIILNKLLSSIPFFANFSVVTYASLLNCVLFVLGLIILGKTFALKTFVSAVTYPIALYLCELLVTTNFLGGFFNLCSDYYASYGEINRILATLFSGLLVGAGCALTFRGGGSSGGVDVIALILCKYFRKLKSSYVVFFVDAVIVISGVFVSRDLVNSLLGIISAFLCALALDKIFVSGQQAVVATVISSEYAAINDAIIHRLNRTSTIVDCVGGYTGENKKMLITTFTSRQYAEFAVILSSIDKQAFVTFHRAHEINGEGWSYEIPEATENAVERSSEKQ